MKTLLFFVYDAFGDWISTNGMIRYLSKQYDKVYLVHDTPVVIPFTSHMFRDNHKIIPIHGSALSEESYDVIDVRIHEINYCPANNGTYFNKLNKFEDNSFPITDNASAFYAELGLNPEIRISHFFYERDYEKEEELFKSLNLPSEYSVICEMNEGSINREYIKHDKIVNLHNLTDNFTDTLKIIENAKDIHLIENSISLFVYHTQHIGKMNLVPIHLHAYARKENHRRCDGPDCNNTYLNMLKYPQLQNWDFIWK